MNAHAATKPQAVQVSKVEDQGADVSNAVLVASTVAPNVTAIKLKLDILLPFLFTRTHTCSYVVYR